MKKKNTQYLTIDIVFLNIPFLIDMPVAENLYKPTEINNLMEITVSVFINSFLTITILQA